MKDCGSSIAFLRQGMLEWRIRKIWGGIGQKDLSGNRRETRKTTSEPPLKRISLQSKYIRLKGVVCSKKNSVSVLWFCNCRGVSFSCSICSILDTILRRIGLEPERRVVD